MPSSASTSCVSSVFQCCIVTSSILTEGLTQKQMGKERWKEGWQGEVCQWLTGIFLFFLFPSLSVCLPLPLSLCVSWPSGWSICLLSLSDLSFTMTRAIQQHTHTHSARLLGQLCVSTALSRISAHCSKKSNPRLPNTHKYTHIHTAPLLISLAKFTCLSKIYHTLSFKTVSYTQQQIFGQCRERKNGFVL